MKKTAVPREARRQNGGQAQQREIQELRARLAEAEETLDAIHRGAVDALVVARPEGEQVFTLQGAESTYRFLVEEMNEGALLLGPDGTVLYANERFAQLANTPLEQVVGSTCARLFISADQPRVARLLSAAQKVGVTDEVNLQSKTAAPRPVAISLRSLTRQGIEGFSVVVTDLTERKAAEGAVRDANEKLELRVEQRTAQLTRANELLLAEMAERKRTEEELRRQREWLRVILTSIGDAVIACDLQRRVTFLNPTAAALTGWSVEDARGQPMAEVFKAVNEQTRQCVPDIVSQVLAEQRVLGLANHTALVSRDGREIPIEDSAAPILDRAGNLAGVVLVFHDVTEKRRAQEALRQSEERLLLAQKAGQVGVLDWDLTTNQMVWSPQMEEVFGVPVGGFEGRYEAWAARVHPEDSSLVEQTLRDWLASGRQTAEWEYRILRQGEERWIAWRGQVLRNPAGAPVRVVGTNLDITERKRFQSELERLVADRTAKLQELVGHLEHFSYSLVHDMRAPLRAMRSFSGILLDECAPGLDPTHKDLLGRIGASAVRMDRLITDALSYTKAVREELPLEGVDTDELLRSMLNSYPNFRPPQMHIEIVGTLPMVLGNAAGLTQCFSNLLNNAIKFVTPGQTPHVRVWAEQRPSPPERGVHAACPDAALNVANSAAKDRRSPITDHSSGVIRLWFEDNGIGIAPEHQQCIFDMFRQLNPGSEGTGIGLALVQKVIRAMRGAVGVESTPGKGSRFWIDLEPAP